MEIRLSSIPVREVLHFLGWRGNPEPTRELLDSIGAVCSEVLSSVQPRVALRQFDLEEDGAFAGTAFCAEGEDVRRLLAPCHAGVLMAATLGAQSERMLLYQGRRPGGAARLMLLDAAMSAAIEAVCDQAEARLRADCLEQGLYLTDRFSPGYGDMPIGQSRAICEVLSSGKTIGLTVSGSGVLIPRKSVTAVMGVSRTPVPRRPAGCAGCAARETCSMRRNEG